MKTCSLLLRDHHHLQSRPLPRHPRANRRSLSSLRPPNTSPRWSSHTRSCRSLQDRGRNMTAETVKKIESVVTLVMNSFERKFQLVSTTSLLGPTATPST